jgi:transaldolase
MVPVTAFSHPNDGNHVYPCPAPVIHRGTSRFFLDTANVQEWKELLPTGIFHGVTTNPTLFKRAKEPCTIANVHRLANHLLSNSDHYYCQEFMCQAWGSTVDDLYTCGMEVSALDPRSITIKVPVTQQGVSAAAKLIQAGRRVCLTACYNHRQALLAASVGAEYIAPYLGRMTEQAGVDGLNECCTMQQIVVGMKSSTRILVASIRDVDTLVHLTTQCQMDTFTFSADVARQLFVNNMTDQAAFVFEQDAQP